MVFGINICNWVSIEIGRTILSITHENRSQSYIYHYFHILFIRVIFYYIIVISLAQCSFSNIVFAESRVPFQEFHDCQSFQTYPKYPVFMSDRSHDPSHPNLLNCPKRDDGKWLSILSTKINCTELSEHSAPKSRSKP